MNDPATCEHQQWKVDNHVHRTTDAGGKLIAVHLEVSLTCEGCGTPFWFPGMSTGTSYNEPVTTTDGFTAKLPAVMANTRNNPDPILHGVSIRTGDVLKGRKR